MKHFFIPLKALITLLFCTVFFHSFADTDSALDTSLSKAIAQFNQNLNEPAEKIFRALSKKPEHQNQVYYYLSLIQLRLGNRDKAKAYLTLAKEITPDTVRERVLEGDMLCQQAQEVSIFKAMSYAKQCIAAYEQAISIEPNNTYALAAAIKYYLQAPAIVGGSDNKAEEKLLILTKLDPNRADSINAKRYLAQGKKDQAM